MESLAIVLSDQGKLDEARVIYEKVLEVQRTLGPENPDTLSTMNNLASVIQDREEKHALLLEVAEARRRVLGPEHPQTLSSMMGAAMTVPDAAEAQEQFQQILAIRKRILGAEHSATLNVMHELARVLSFEGRFEESHSLARQTLELRRRLIGRDHPNTRNTQCIVANALEGLGRMSEARELWEDLLELSRDDVVCMARLATNIALTEDALPADRLRAIGLARKAIDLDPNSFESWRAIGLVYAVSDEWQKSLDAFKRALQIGYQYELIPAWTFRSIEQRDHQRNEHYQQLIELLRKHTRETQPHQ